MDDDVTGTAPGGADKTALSCPPLWDERYAAPGFLFGTAP